MVPISTMGFSFLCHALLIKVIVLGICFAWHDLPATMYSVNLIYVMRDIEFVLNATFEFKPINIVMLLIERHCLTIFLQRLNRLNTDHFYTPVWKTGRIMPWQCPSVRPSVHVFRTFLQHALRYQFETWYIHSVGGTSSLSCITIGSFWPSLQPKVGQTHFLQSWPHKSR